jgi:hypothetical protein
MRFVRAGTEAADRRESGGGMMIPSFFHPRKVAKGNSMGRLLRHIQRSLSCMGNDRARGEVELCRLSGLPSCCFTHVADKQK